MEGEGGRLAVESIRKSEYNQGRNNVLFCLFELWVNLALVQPEMLYLPYWNWSVGTLVSANGSADGVGILVDDGADAESCR